MNQEKTQLDHEDKLTLCAYAIAKKLTSGKEMNLPHEIHTAMDILNEDKQKIIMPKDTTKKEMSLRKKRPCFQAEREEVVKNKNL